MESSTVDIGRVAPPPRRWAIDRRLMGVAIAIEIVAVGLAYMVVYIPVLGPKLTRHEADQHWLAAAVAAAIVVSFGIVITRAGLRARRASAPRERLIDADEPSGIRQIPESLKFASVPRVWVLRAAAFSLSTLPVSIVLGAHLWQGWLAILAPWFVIVGLEARHRYLRFPLFACFGLLVILQLLHMVEHSTQLLQLILTHGSLRRSHGVIGQLDFETVHFVADTTLWLSLGWLVVSLKGRNTWLWVAFAAASMHEIEHLFLVWMYFGQNTVYLSGGAAGIMGKHGLIGSPLDRPYLHYAYNFIVIVPMLIALWDEARHVDRVERRRARKALAARA